jgi:hypothetical protein
MKYFLLLLLSAINIDAAAQAKIRKLPNNINHPSINVFAPYMSFDANALVFLSDNGDESNTLSLVYSFKENSDWKDPVVAPKLINTRLNFLRGYALSADGKKMYFTSMKSPGVGGYDILMSEFKGSMWSDPQNLGIPINSKGNEACPSFTFDGNAVYFMRCEKMTFDKGENCKIFMAKKKSTGQWDEPVELPPTINTGNSQTPRIMADGETLIFSSDKIPGNKGGMDLYLAKFSNGNWTAPTPLEFVNTAKDDQYITVNALGRYLIKDSPGTRKNEFVEYLIPNEIRPKGVTKINGSIVDPAGAPTPAYISVIDLATKKRVYNGRPLNDGSFLFYLTEGGSYELSVDAEQGNYTYFSKQFDLTVDKIPQAEKVNVVLKPIGAGDEIALDVVKFKPNSSEIDPSSYEALKRLVRLMKQAPALKFQIQVMLTGYKEDTIRSTPDLTEIISDSVKTKFDDIDSLGQLYKRDTVLVKTTFHNDRTLKQATTIVNYLISQGADANNLTIFGNAIEATIPDNRKTVVKAAVRAK